jgi:RimJ/RimL family protein N-acetyltransferase
MEELVQFNPKIHLDDFRQLCIESFTWHWDEIWENYKVDMVPSFGTPTEFVDRQLESYASLKPPEGILLILEVDGETAGMGAITRFNDDICEVHRMYNRPQYRGRGYAQMILSRLLETGRELGYSTFRLTTPLFAYAAQHIYRKAGFQDVEDFREKAHPIARQYWICMEMKD